MQSITVTHFLVSQHCHCNRKVSVTFSTGEEDRAAGDQIVLGTITWAGNSDSDMADMAAGRAVAFDRASATVTLGAGKSVNSQSINDYNFVKIDKKVSKNFNFTQRNWTRRGPLCPLLGA